MAKSTVATYGAEGMSNALRILPDPEHLTIVGIDCPEAECPELADPDRLEPGPEFEGLVQSIMHFGFVGSTISIRKIRGSEKVFVVNGRQRVLATREANRRLQAENPRAVLILVLATVDTKGDAKGSAVTKVISNEHTRIDGVLAKARNAQRMRDMGHDEVAIAAMFAVTTQSLRNWQALLTASPQILSMVERGKLSANTAIKVSALPAEEQQAAIDAAATEGGTIDSATVRAGIDGRKNAKKAGANPAEASSFVPWKQADLKRLCTYLDPKDQDEERDGAVTEQQLAIFELLRVVTGQSAGRKLADFCDGNLSRWVKDCAPGKDK